jgi:hypothetical protein
MWRQGFYWGISLIGMVERKRFRVVTARLLAPVVSLKVI